MKKLLCAVTVLAVSTAQAVTIFVDDLVGAGSDDDLVRVHGVVDGGLDRAVRVADRAVAGAGAVADIDVNGGGVDRRDGQDGYGTD